MGFRFQKRISILPGVRLNLSKSGASWSVGPRGASINIGKRGVYGNVGLPGTGLSYRERLDKPAGRAGNTRGSQRAPSGPEMPERVVARLVGDEVQLLGPSDQPLNPALVPEAKRLMKNDLRKFLDDHASDRNLLIEGICHLHHDIPVATGTVAPGESGKPNQEHYFDQQSYMQALMQWRAAEANAGPDKDAICDAVLEKLAALEWPAETNIAISLNGTRLLLDVDLPEIEDMPDATWKPSYTGLRLDLKPRAKKDLAAFYLEHVCSVMLRLLGHSFAVTDQLQTIAISAYTQRTGSTGKLSDEYVATIECSRGDWGQIDLTQISHINPHQCLRRLGAKIEAGSRGTLLIQQPLD
ncbi:hypothetical protein A9D14_06655 [Croceicoccus marinus]|uniref:DUF4236 domain-containing protein n=2 Tax=Croceicoccus marinus TaxID=450378 RepID=A0A1Z1FAU7_9SPHN|nr:hypothetical protein A9D14_06655 [Croceicoccus marinus]